MVRGELGREFSKCAHVRSAAQEESKLLDNRQAHRRRRASHDQKLVVESARMIRSASSAKRVPRATICANEKAAENDADYAVSLR
jgi:hypothetical protein